jgi:hypothetical protein
MQGNPHRVELFPVHEATNHLELSVVLEIRKSDVDSVIRAGILVEVHERSRVWQMLIGFKSVHKREPNNKSHSPIVFAGFSTF